jgi:hypothetical protein
MFSNKTSRLIAALTMAHLVCSLHCFTFAIWLIAPYILWGPSTVEEAVLSRLHPILPLLYVFLFPLTGFCLGWVIGYFADSPAFRPRLLSVLWWLTLGAVCSEIPLIFMGFANDFPAFESGYLIGMLAALVVPLPFTLLIAYFVWAWKRAGWEAEQMASRDAE